MHGSSCCLASLKVLEKFIGAKPLLRKLFFQMDNCVKNNKDRQLLVFLSFLTTRNLFEEMKLGFLVVGHTHEDTYGNFGYISKKLKE
jgi:hypothetical protein